jgi:CubicO group peptidase (beta-lactamase class C family)
MKDWQVPGMAIAIVRDNETIYQKTFGVRKVNGTDKVTNNIRRRSQAWCWWTLGTRI